jgi:hypothetical protein
MKTSPFLTAFSIAFLGTVLFSSTPLLADESDMLNKAFDLVHQALNPGGDPPSDAERTDLLKQAVDLAENSPDHQLAGHRVKAIRDIKAALFLLKDGDADHHADAYIRDASVELRAAIALVE